MNMSDTNLLRLIIGAACVVLIVAIYFLGRPRKPDQGRRVDGKRTDARTDAGRTEPTLGESMEHDLRNATPGSADGDTGPDEAPDGEAARPGSLRPSLVGSPGRSAVPSHPTLGIRREERFDRIVTLYVAARAGRQLNGPDLIVAAEKAGLVHGHMGIYHRLVDGKPELEPVFSVANMVKPGNFDLTQVNAIHTPGINFFMTLPAPVSALDAWDAMLPTAQRMAELLDALVLDEERNALGRQRIAHIRDELRAYDRRREQQNIRPGR